MGVEPIRGAQCCLGDICGGGGTGVSVSISRSLCLLGSGLGM